MTTRYNIQANLGNIAIWERYVPFVELGSDWSAYTSFKGQQDDSLSKRIRFLNLAQLVRQAPASGIFAECGCYNGHSTHVIASMMKLSGRNVPLYVFDSFAGLSPPTSEDQGGNSNASRMYDRMQSGEQLFAADLETVRSNLAEHTNIQYFPGWIPERFAEVADKNFAFVHIDVDIYAPTRDSLEFFYPRLAKGGFIQIDDYNSIDWPGCNKAVNEFMEKYPPALFVQLPLSGAFLIK